MFSQSKVSSVPSAARQIHFWGWWSSTSKPDNTNTRNPSPTEPIMTSWPRLLPRVQTIRTSVTYISSEFPLRNQRINLSFQFAFQMSNTLISWNSWHLMYKSQIVSIGTKYKHNPYQTAINKVLGLEETPYDTLWCLHKAAWILLRNCIGHVC